MNSNDFDICKEAWERSSGNQRFWPELADELGYESGEILRSRFKREREARGFEKVTGKVVQQPDKFLKIGIIDIETLYMELGGWGLYDQTFSPSQILKDGCMLSWAAKYVGSDTIYSDIMTPDEAVVRDTRRIAESAWDFVRTCEICVGHNFKSFDGKILNTEFLLNDLQPLRYRTIDTLEIAKNNFRVSSNRMEYINHKLKIRQKISNEGFKLWKRCSEGDIDALDMMTEYNVGDIFATEELFWKLQPYMSNMPNLSLYNQESNLRACSCGSTNLFREKGFWYTQSARYEKYRCGDCGSLMRGKSNLISKSKRDGLMVRV